MSGVGAARLSAALDRAERVLVLALGGAFAALIAVVFYQVVARNLLMRPALWTMDAAQLLFSWTIFLGTAVLVRRGAHYRLDVLPASFLRANAALALFADLCVGAVAAVLLVYGIAYVRLGLGRTSEALGLTEAWFFVPLPLAGAFVLLILAERLPADLRALRP